MTINIDSVNLGTDPVAACLLPGWKQQGQLTEMSRSGSMMSETRTDYYGYNDRSELVSGTKDTAATNLTEYAYQYDDIGNRIESLDLGTNRTYVANALNQYTQISNLCDSRLSLRSAWSLPHGSRPPSRGGYASLREEFIPQYDLDMRPRQRRRVARRSEATEPRSGCKRPRNQTLVRTATGDWTVAYNAENRPVSWTCGATNIVMLFDRMGRRVEYVETVTDGSGESTVTTTNRHHRFVYEITAAQAGRAHWALQAERTERSDEVPREPRYLCVQRLNARSGNAIELSFAWDPTEPVATRPLVLQRQGGWNFFYTHDGNKNVSDVVSFQQARGVPAHYEYAPFGAVTAATTNTAFTAFNVAETNPYRFSSEYSDDTLGLVYYNYRHYEPVTGRWLRRDDFYEYGGLNLYCLNKNCIINITDCLGLADDSCMTPGSLADYEMVITAKRRGHPMGSDPKYQKAAEELLASLKKLGYVSGAGSVATGGGVIGAITAVIDYLASQNMAPGTDDFNKAFEGLMSPIDSTLRKEPLTLVGHIDYKICDCVDGKLRFVPRRYPSSDDWKKDLSLDANPFLPGGMTQFQNEYNELKQRLYDDWYKTYKDDQESIRERMWGKK